MDWLQNAIKNLQTNTKQSKCFHQKKMSSFFSNFFISFFFFQKFIENFHDKKENFLTGFQSFHIKRISCEWEKKTSPRKLTKEKIHSNFLLLFYLLIKSWAKLKYNRKEERKKKKGRWKRLTGCRKTKDVTRISPSISFFML